MTILARRPGFLAAVLILCGHVLPVFGLPPLGNPLQDPVHHDNYVMNYFDLQPGAGELDYSCDEPHTYDGHNGTDFSVYSFRAMDQGTWVVAAAPGTVHSVRWDQFDRNYELPYLGSGNFVRVDHDDGSLAYYWHLLENSVAVEPGERVERGQRLGLIGSSGASPIPHLHFETWDGGRPVDPFSGPCNNDPGAWIEQPRYAGEYLFRVMDAGVTDQPIALPDGVYQLNNGLRPLKDTPLPAAVVADSVPALSLWVHFQGRAGVEYRFALVDPDGSVAWSQDHLLAQRREFAWHLQRVPLTVLGQPVARGQWRFRIMRRDEVLHDQAFGIGAESAYPPRFYPLAGRAVRVDGAYQEYPLEFIGGTAGEVRLFGVGLPDNVWVVDGELRVGARAMLPARLHTAMAVAVDAAGRHDRFVIHFVDPRVPVDTAWAAQRPDRQGPHQTGAWYNPVTAGQGLFLEHYGSSDLLFAGWFAFGLSADQAPREPDWLVASGKPRRNQTVLDLVRADGGRLLDPVAPVAFSEPGSVGTMALVTNGCHGELVVDFSDRELVLDEPALRRIVQSEACLAGRGDTLSATARRVNGNWFDPAMNGQGILFEYVDGQGLLFANWFTFDTAGERAWFALSGDYAEPVASLDVYRVASGRLQQPGASDSEIIGQAEITWSETCGRASLQFTAADGDRYATELIKIDPDSCPAN